MDSFDMFCLWLGRVTLFGGIIFMVLMLCGFFALMALGKVFGRDKMDECELIAMRTIELMRIDQRKPKEPDESRQRTAEDGEAADTPGGSTALPS